MTKTKTKIAEDPEPEPIEEKEEYLTYTWEVTGNVHIEFHNCHDVRIMSGQPSPPNWPPK